MTNAKPSRAISWVFKLALTLAAFWLVMRNIHYAQLEEILQKQDRDYLLEAFALLAAQIALGGVRWQFVLNALANAGRSVFPLIEALRLYYITVFFNNCLPGTVGGDFMRVWLARSDHVPLTLSVNSVIIDRLLALVALGLMVLTTLPVLGGVAGFDPAMALPVAVTATIAGILFLIFADRVLKPFEHVKPVRWALFFIHCLRMMLKHPVASLFSLIFALMAHICYCLCAYVLAQSMGLDLSLLEALTLLPLALLAITLPISIGGWGVREAVMVGMLGMIGIGQAGALAISVQLGLFNVLLSLPAGFLWLARRRQIPQR